MPLVRVLLIGLMLVLAACGGGQPEPTPEPATTTTRVKTCADFNQQDFIPEEGDPHNLDPDGDGIACESGR